MSTNPVNPTNPTVQTMHYGGSISPKTGRLGRKPVKGQHFKARRRLETIVRLENAGFTKPQIATMLVISTNRLTHLMITPEYLNTRVAITHGIVVDQEAQLSVIKAQSREMLKQFLPPAMLVIANELQSPDQSIAGRKLKVSIVKDLWDREGTFAKVSRTEIKPVDHFDFERADASSRGIIAAIKGIAPAISAQQSVAAVKIHNEFSNCHTLSAIDQQAALQELERAAAAGEFDPGGSVN